MLVLLAGCADFVRGEPPDEVDGGGSPPVMGGDAGTALSFATAVHPLLTSGCQSCHRIGGLAGESGYLLSGDASADFAAALERSNLTTPSQSRLLLKAAGQSHGGGVIYPAGSTEYQTLLAWITGGADP